jgi:two-component system phosphate regulon response regulator PhoB
LTAVLIIEGINERHTILRETLENSGMRVMFASDAKKALSTIEASPPNLIVFDVPDHDPHLIGSELMAELRQHKDFEDIPAIIVAHRHNGQGFRGPESGADDTIYKPLDPHELITRIKAVLRKRSHRISSGHLELGGIEMYLDEHRIIIEGKEALLRPMEFRLLEFFMRNAEKVFSRRQLLDKVWGQSVFIEERTVDVHIRRLRNILDVHHKGELIQTVRGFGYRFSERV